MILTNETILEVRKAVYKNHKDNIENICFTIFECDCCGIQIMDQTLMPILDKSQLTNYEYKNTNEDIIQKLFKLEFDFLSYDEVCQCTHHSIVKLHKIIYCYYLDKIDFHAYISYPFTTIEKSQFLMDSIKESENFLFFDTETVGLPLNWKKSYKNLENWPRLVQIAWILADADGKIIEQDNYIVKPNGFIIPESATEIHGITNSKALQIGSELTYVLNKFNKCAEKADYIVAHNINFDFNVISSELYRQKIESTFYQLKQICTMQSTTDYCKIPGNYGYKFPKLAELYKKLFGENLEGAHDATIDINATFKCFYKLTAQHILHYK